MKSHMMNVQEQQNEEFVHASQEIMSDENESASAASYTDNENDEKGVPSYELRENPKKSIRSIDFDAGLIVLQDRESETETSKKLRTRKRSRRTRKSSSFAFKNQEESPSHDTVVVKNLKNQSWGAEAEQLSSVSDTTTEEDVAYCLMMLSRDKWKEKQVLHPNEDEYDYEDDEEEEQKSFDETEESEEIKISSKNRSRGKYKCETCNKLLRSYQALGGHRASHKKIKTSQVLEKVKNATSCSLSIEKKIHECPFCSRVFNSGQALGGHKRSHFINGSGGVLTTAAAATVVASTSSSTKFVEHFIDLNLPAPVEEDDEFSHVELSAVSDAEFVNPIKE